jgi:hypothetical protein
VVKTRVLITVTAYPQPSRSHDELVCTAGLVRYVVVEGFAKIALPAREL